MLTRRSFLVSAAALPVGAVASQSVASNASPEILSYSGAAIGGYDPVAYFTHSKPISGSDDYALTWKGALWRFASAENKAMFEADPEAYAPKYGGYCAYAAARGYIAPTAANAWTVHEGKLYLNYNRHVRDIWLSEKLKFIEMADANWPGPLTA